MDNDRYLNISPPSDLPGNINFNTGFARKKRPNAQGNAITIAIFIAICIFSSSSACFFKTKFSAIIGIKDVHIAIERVSGTFTITDALPVS